MKLLLTSAGITNKTIANALTVILDKPLAEVRATFIPTAKTDRDISTADAIASQLSQLSKWKINPSIVDPQLDDDWREKLSDIDLVIIGGGNTFHLLNEARSSGFADWLKENIENKVYMGTSAGSIIMTPDIAVASVDYGDENVVGITDLSGLGLVDFEVSPHTPEDVSVEANLEYSKLTERKLLMIDNNSAVVVDDNGISVVSEGHWNWCRSGSIL